LSYIYFNQQNFLQKLINFPSKFQLDQHEEYHKSPEWFNLWLIYCKKYQPNNPDAKLEPLNITEPSEYYKYKPSAENSIPKAPRASQWDLSWEEWDDAAQKPCEDKESLPTCDICGEEFLHQNTLDIHKQRPNCLELKLELFKPLKLDVVDVSDSKENNKKEKQKEPKMDLEDSWLYLSDSSSNSGSELDEPVMDDSSNQDMKFDESMTNDVVLGEFF
jgi:hypothetical protein